MSTPLVPPVASDDAVTLPEAQVGDAPPVEGSTIGRYMVLGLLGHGGMGVVLRAFDPKLDRKIALKLLHGGSSSEAQARLQREAQALARLSHPNVIRVHDVGTHQGRVFIAMELVTGSTLADWIRQGPHPWREVVRVFMLAGEGVAAAHDAGLVHRDFKPANVLIGEDGQVKVTDFGLARAQADLPRHSLEPASQSLSGLDPPSLEATLTRTGALVGTPAYMAPEQIQGQMVDPRSDQFSFCVALYEGLTGQRPFEGATLAQIALAIERQRPGGTLPTGIPRGLTRALRRGLRVDPEARHPDMRSLLRTMRRARNARRRQASWALATAMVGGGAWWAMQSEAQPSGDYCTRIEQRLDGVWDDTRRAEAERAFQATGLRYAADTWALTVARVDAQATRWVDAQRNACEAEAALFAKHLPDNANRGSIDARAALDRQMVCLHRRYAELRQLGDLLRKADAALVERAPRVVDSLGSIESCARWADEPADMEGPEALAMAEALGEVEILQEAGHYDEAVAAAQAARATMGDAPRALQAELHLAVARALADAGEPKRAEQESHQAFSSAVAGGHERVAILAALGLAIAQITHAKEPNFDEAERWTDHAQGALAQMGAGAEYEGRIENARGRIDYQRGNYEAAHEHFDRALRLREQDLGPDNYRIANYHYNLGQALSTLERTDEALEHQRRALELERSRYGNNHPRVASSLAALCSAYSSAGRTDDAIRTGLEAVALLRKTVGNEHPKLGTALINLGSAQARAGDTKGAEASFLAALDNTTAAYGPEHRRAGLVLNNLGVHYEMTGNLAEAERFHRKAAAVFDKTLGPEHPNAAIVTCNLAGILIKEGKLDEAEPLVRRTLPVLEQRLGPEHPNVSLPLMLLAQVHVERQQPAQAQPLLERALALRAPGRAPPEEIADVHYALGHVLWLLGDDRSRAIELVTRAYQSNATLGDARTDEAEQARRWLAERDALGEGM
ncbi:MAG: serine/threonine-protein kinase [Myxococcota bacterium]